MQAWSHDFLGEGVADTALAFVTERFWKRAHQEFPEAKRVFALVSAGEKQFPIALGQPVSVEDVPDTEPRIYIPQWLVAMLELDGCGDSVGLEWIYEEAFPEATRLVLRPHDSAFYHADAREELEGHLTRFGVLTAGTTVTIPISVLGGFPIEFDVVVTEPAGTVLLQGDEVALEFEGALDDAPFELPREVPTAVSAAPEVAATEFGEFKEADDDEPMVPSAAPTPQAQGHVLGGTARPRLADGRAWNPWRAGGGGAKVS